MKLALDNTRSPLLNHYMTTCSNHIKNILTEIPAQTSDGVNYGSYEKQGCDYRDAAVVLPRMMRDQQAQLQVPDRNEIGRILYSRESQRTSQSILRLHLVNMDSIKRNPLTRRKLWGPMHFWHMLQFCTG